jgi:hypothetical protein
MRRLYRKGGRETWANGKKNREKVPNLWAEGQMNPTAIGSVTGDAELKAGGPRGGRRAWIVGGLRHLDLDAADPSGDDVVEGGATNPTMNPVAAERKGGARTQPTPVTENIPPWPAGRWAQIMRGGWWRDGDLTRINHTFLNKFFFTERTEFRTEVTEPNTWSAL